MREGGASAELACKSFMKSGPLHRRILIVEDGPSIRNVLYVLLAGLRCEGEIATSGREALAKISQLKYDAVKDGNPGQGRNFLDFRKCAGGKSEPHYNPCNISALITPRVEVTLHEAQRLGEEQCR